LFPSFFLRILSHYTLDFFLFNQFPFVNIPFISFLAIAACVNSGGVGFEPITHDGNVDVDQGSYLIAFVEQILTSPRSH
jgi:hypothetical protein